jgi:two-component system chemotaxis response regulator CheY
MNILVVDDERALRSLVRRVLEDDNSVRVVEADDGVTALDRLVNEPIDLVLLDLSMKSMDGIETLQAIRRSPRFSLLPVVLMTGNADEEFVRRAMALGIDDFLVKPFTPDTLRERLERFRPVPSRRRPTSFSSRP